MYLTTLHVVKRRSKLAVSGAPHSNGQVEEACVRLRCYEPEPNVTLEVPVTADM